MTPLTPIWGHRTPLTPIWGHRTPPDPTPTHFQVFSQHCPFLMGPIEGLADVVTPDTDIQVGTGDRGHLRGPAPR